MIIIQPLLEDQDAQTNPSHISGYRFDGRQAENHYQHYHAQLDVFQQRNKDVPAVAPNPAAAPQGPVMDVKPHDEEQDGRPVEPYQLYATQ